MPWSGLVTFPVLTAVLSNFTGTTRSHVVNILYAGNIQPNKSAFMGTAGTCLIFTIMSRPMSINCIPELCPFENPSLSQTHNTTKALVGCKESLTCKKQKVSDLMKVTWAIATISPSNAGPQQ